MISNQVFDLDINPNGRAPVARLFASQYDNGRPVEIHLLVDGEPYDIAEGATVTLCERKPSGNVVEIPVAYGAGSNVLLFNLVTQQTAEAGLCLCEVKIDGDGQDPLGTHNFYLDVEPSPMEGGDPSETWIYSVEEKLAQVEEDYGEIQAIADNIEDTVARAEAAAEAVEAIEPELETLVTRMNTAEGDIDTLEGSVASAEADITALGGRMTSAEGGITGNAADITALTTRVSTAEGNITGLSGRMQTAEGDIDSLETAMDAAESGIAGNAADIQGLDARADSLETSVAGLSTRMQTAESDIDTAQADIEDLKTITAIIRTSSAGLHNSIYGGRDLGASVSAAQRAAITGGGMEDIWLGDFWRSGSVDWVVVDMNYAPNIGRPHLVIMPRGNLYQARMNASNTAAGGYASSEMYTSNLAQAVTQIENAFGDLVIEHSETLINATVQGRASGVANFTVKAVLPSTFQLIGSPSMEIMSNSGATATLRESYMRRFNLFNVRPDLVVPTDANGNKSEMWLRSNATETYFMILNTAGTTFNLASTSERGVRPYFFIG